MAKLATFLFGTKKMPQSHALSKFLYYSQTLPTLVSPAGERYREGVFAIQLTKTEQLPVRGFPCASTAILIPFPLPKHQTMEDGSPP